MLSNSSCDEHWLLWNIFVEIFILAIFCVSYDGSCRDSEVWSSREWETIVFLKWNVYLKEIYLLKAVTLSGFIVVQVRLSTSVLSVSNKMRVRAPLFTSSHVHLYTCMIRIYIYIHTLTPLCWVLLELLTGLQLVKKFPAFCGDRMFITALTSVRHYSRASIPYVNVS